MTDKPSTPAATAPSACFSSSSKSSATWKNLPGWRRGRATPMRGSVGQTMPTRPQTHRPKWMGGASAHGERPSAAKRGYDRHWQRFRRHYLAENPLCVACDRNGKLALATDIHHRIPMRQRPDLQYVEANLVSLCHACHSSITASGG